MREELGEGQLAVLVHELVEGLDLGHFEAEGSEQGRPGYPPQLLLKVWLYAYTLGVRPRGAWNSASGRTWDFAIWRANASRIMGP